MQDWAIITTVKGYAINNEIREGWWDGWRDDGE